MRHYLWIAADLTRERNDDYASHAFTAKRISAATERCASDARFSSWTASSSVSPRRRRQSFVPAFDFGLVATPYFYQ